MVEHAFKRQQQHFSAIVELASRVLDVNHRKVNTSDEICGNIAALRRRWHVSKQ